jgi:hypothetical protein
VVRRVLSSAPLVRQAILLTLAHPMEPSATLLRDGRAKDIILGHFGELPNGLLGALSRMPRTLPSVPLYRSFWRLFADPQKARLLQALTFITADTVKVLHTLTDPPLIHPNVVRQLGSAANAYDLMNSVAFLRTCSTDLTDETLAEAFRNSQSLPRTVAKFLQKADRFPAHPIQGGDAALRPLASSADIVAAARKYRNCLRSQIADALGGRVAFGEFDGRAICELRPLADGLGWLLADVHVADNALVPPPVRDAARQKCAEHGIVNLAMPESSTAWKSVKRMIRQVDPFAFAA